MLLPLNIQKVIIVTGSGCGPDHVSLYTEYPSPIPGLTKEPLTVDFIVAAEGGERYVRDVLLIPPALVEVIRRPKVDHQFDRSKR